jgi:hypothetical protein
MDNLLDAIAEGWSWKIGRPIELIATNAFGNAIVKTDLSYFRIISAQLSTILREYPIR